MPRDESRIIRETQPRPQWLQIKLTKDTLADQLMAQIIAQSTEQKNNKTRDESTCKHSSDHMAENHNRTSPGGMN